MFPSSFYPAYDEPFLSEDPDFLFPKPNARATVADLAACASDEAAAGDAVRRRRGAGMTDAPVASVVARRAMSRATECGADDTC